MSSIGSTLSKPLPVTREAVETHPIENWLRMDRMPHIWCPGCGIGTSVNCFTRAVEESGLSREDVTIVSGIGCTGRVSGYLKLDSFHTTHGRAIPFATGLKLASPKTKVIVYSGDGDLFAIGGNHFIHAARRNVDIAVLCVNNFNYGMTGGQVAPTTPTYATASTTPYGSIEQPFNLPLLAQSSGAIYVARWTVYHVKQLTRAIKEAIGKSGFTFVEIIAPCPTLFVRRNRLGDGLAVLQAYRENSVIKNGADVRECDLVTGGPIVCGKFTDGDRPSYVKTHMAHMRKVLGDRYKMPESWKSVA